MKLPPYYSLSPEVVKAQSIGSPIVALESAVITHGLPYPENLDLARRMEDEVRSQGSVPATVAVVDGKICIGLNDMRLERLAKDDNLMKISSRDLGPAVAKKKSGGTTVAGTMAAASKAGIRVFATGGIGGVHRQIPGDPKPSSDISADLMQLAHTPMIVVCAGAKAILDLSATLEILETLEVPVVGYQSDNFPAFYSRSSGFKAGTRADTPDEVVTIAHAHWELGMRSGILVVVPPPEEVALPNEVVEVAIQKALAEAKDKKIRGQEVTPFLLGKMVELTRGKSLQVNLALLENNARLAGSIAHSGFQISRSKTA
jgi:pseudouridine-5'-phosphate glycosidase